VPRLAFMATSHGGASWINCQREVGELIAIDPQERDPAA
jgi:hypothetical protein